MKMLNRIMRGSIDPRCAYGVKIPLYDILTVNISAILSRQADTYVASLITLRWMQIP